MTSTPTSLRIACADLNGLMRGKRLPIAAAADLEFSGHRMPRAALCTDVLGQPLRGGPTGDGHLRCTERGPVPMPWLELPATLYPMWMFTDESRPDPTCPRHALARLLRQWSQSGISPQVEATIEVTLVDDTGTVPAPATTGAGGDPALGQLASLVNLDGFGGFLDALFAGAEAMGIDLREAETGASLAQFRLRLAPLPALRAADDLWLLRALIHGTARAQGLTACFMAKPFEGQPGNGLHLQFSLGDRTGRNLFDNGLKTGSVLMHQAVAGCVSFMPGATLIFAPFGESFGRFAPDSLAPTSASWGYENRTTALRIPTGDPAQQAIEHRTPGADANPYLALAAILGAAMAGIEDDLSPPPPLIGNAYKQRVLQFPMDWDAAIERFGQSPRMARVFTGDLIRDLTALKRQEQARLPGSDPAEVLPLLLGIV